MLFVFLSTFRISQQLGFPKVISVGLTPLPKSALKLLRQVSGIKISTD